MKFNAKRVAFLGALTALALITFLIESLFPPLIVPGAKIGLSNIFVLYTLVVFSFPEALLLFLAKCLLGSFFAGNFAAVIYSLPAGLCSLLVSYILVRCFSDKISLVSVAVASAVINNLVQCAVFALVVQSTLVLSYTPYLALLGVLAGAVTGFVTFFANKRRLFKTAY